MDLKERAQEVLRRLKERFPGASTSLDYRTPWELLVATILSAQCTDALVNKVTPKLFARWPGPAELAEADAADIDETIHSVSFHTAKARNLKATARMVRERFGGQPPRTMAEMVELPGVARKTANVVLNTAYGVHEGIAVDTHVKRIAFRLGLTASDKPVVVEKDLVPLYPPKDWGAVNHLLILHGRETCRALRPKCPACILADLCPKYGVTEIEPAKAKPAARKRSAKKD